MDATVAAEMVPRTMSRTTRTADHRWRAIAHRVYEEEETCWLCGQWVNQELPHRHPMARSADHLVQLRHGGDEHDRSNCRLAHYGCNSTRSGRLQNVARDQCACRYGRPCAPIGDLGNPRGRIATDPSTV